MTGIIGKSRSRYRATKPRRANRSAHGDPAAISLALAQVIDEGFFHVRGRIPRHVKVTSSRSTGAPSSAVSVVSKVVECVVNGGAALTKECTMSTRLGLAAEAGERRQRQQSNGAHSAPSFHGRQSRHKLTREATRLRYRLANAESFPDKSLQQLLGESLQ